MKKVVCWLLSQLNVRLPLFRGKLRLMRMFSRLTRGGVIKSTYDVYLEADLKDNTNMWSIVGFYNEVAEELKGLNSGDCFIDIGANAGLFSLLAAKEVGCQGVVLSFEPQKEIYKKLLANIRLNRLDNVFCFNFAVSDATHVVSMERTSKSHTGLASIVPDAAGTIWALNISEDFPALVSIIGNRPTSIKIDVEGHEYQVLKSLSKFFDAIDIRKIVIEIDTANLSQHSSKAEEIYTYMAEKGFSPKFSVGYKNHYDEVFVKTG